MKGEGPFADQVRTMFEIARRKYGLEDKPKLSTAAFRRPQMTGDQLGLFGS
jgi:hypothetical protein